MLLYTAFHLNMCYSSIEEAQRPEIVARCYWPLLRLIEETPLLAGIEAPAYTLEVIERIDPGWIAALRRLIDLGKVEFLGSGYAQIIGPIVPAAVNAANLAAGRRRYRQLLGLQPRIVVVNEQAYSSGLIANYLAAGYSGIVVEWNNAARAHPEWPRASRLEPFIARDQYGRRISGLWNDSVAFQKLQRVAHGEMEVADYLSWLSTVTDPAARCLCFYGNDVEVFDFRPGRFATEPPLHESSEWTRIRDLVLGIAASPDYEFALPSTVLTQASGPERSLESAAMPVLVKKQPKYNITRWAVTGRADTEINSACWRIYQALTSGSADDDAWQELCYLWSSDFRTHITSSRWTQYRERLARAVEQFAVHRPAAAAPFGEASNLTGQRRLIVSAPGIEAVVNVRRGLALDALTFTEVAAVPLVGTVPHGTLDDIALSPDWYTGNLVLECPGAHKVTDLEPAQHVRMVTDRDGVVTLTGSVTTRLGPINKTLIFGRPAGVVQLRYHIDWQLVPAGSLRAGLVTLLPSAFDAATLYFETHNGGPEVERFVVEDRIIDHGASVSFLVSASHALGATEGVIDIGDAHRTIRVEIEKSTAALIGMVTHRPVDGSFFFQLQLSAMELDDTSLAIAEPGRGPREIALRYSARRTGR